MTKYQLDQNIKPITVHNCKKELRCRILNIYFKILKYYFIFKYKYN